MQSYFSGLLKLKSIFVFNNPNHVIGKRGIKMAQPLHLIDAENMPAHLPSVMTVYENDLDMMFSIIELGNNIYIIHEKG